MKPRPIAKKSTKKSTKPKSSKVPAGDVRYTPTKERPRTSVDIKKAENGFVVSQWGKNKERLMVFKTISEAQKAASNLLKL
jgi:hypothetical protein